MLSRRIKRRLTFLQYPIFKITIFLGIGILLGDMLYEWAHLRLLIYAVSAISISASFLTFSHKSYSRRWIFGVAASVAFLCAGSLLLVVERDWVDYGWNEDALYYKGVVLDIPQRGAKTWHSRVRVKAVKDSADWQEIDRNIILYWMPDSTQASVECGDCLCFKAEIKASAKQVTLGDFDYGKYLTRKNISGTAVAYSGDWQILDSRPSLILRQKSLLLREKLVAKYREWGLEGDELAIVMALTAGDKNELDKELRSAYSAAGASHVLALSGMHVGIVAAFIMALLYPLKRLRFGKVIIEVVSVSLLWGFAFITGLSPSVIRAVTLISLFVLGSWVSRTTFNGIMSLSLGAFIMLLVHPQYLFDVGFQMSFSAVFFILYCNIFYVNKINHKNFFSRNAGSALLVTCSAQLGVMPLTLYHFGTFPTYFLLSSFVVIPLATCLLWVDMAALLLHSVPFIGDWLIKALSFLSSVMNTSVEAVQCFPGSQIHLRIVSLQILLLYVFIILFVYISHDRRFPKVLSLIVVGCFILLTAILQKADITFLAN